MKSVNGQKLCNKPSFGSRLTPAYKAAERVVKNLAEEGWQSETFLDSVRYSSSCFSREKFDYHRGLAMLKIAEFASIINTYRLFFQSKFKFSDMDSAYAFLKNVVSKFRALNCEESARLTYLELEKMGIPCRIVYDQNIDHVFVVANRKEPFTSYRDAQKGEVVADFWLKKVYSSVEEAYVDFRRRFGANKKTQLRDKTDISYAAKLDSEYDSQISKQNEANLMRLEKVIEALRRYSSVEASSLKRTTRNIDYKDTRRILHEYIGEFLELSRQSLV